jgi:hypothetical protein
VSGKLAIVDGPGDKLTKAGAPLVTPFAARQQRVGYNAALGGAAVKATGKRAAGTDKANAGPLQLVSGLVNAAGGNG